MYKIEQLLGPAPYGSLSEIVMIDLDKFDWERPVPIACSLAETESYADGIVADTLHAQHRKQRPTFRA